MNLGIEGKRALVVGGNKGLGRAVASALVSEGADVVLLGRDQRSLVSTAEELTSLGFGKAHALTADLARWETVASALEQATTMLEGSVEILVNNSGGPPPGLITDVEPAVWREQFELLVLSYIRLANWALPQMRVSKWGRILNISSRSVIQPIPNLGISNTLRSAIVGWAKTLAGEVAADGITVNTLLAGRIATNRTKEMDASRAHALGISTDEANAEQCKLIPVGRSGKPEEFAALAAFLASPLAGFLTGSTFRIDGGAIQSV